MSRRRTAANTGEAGAMHRVVRFAGTPAPTGNVTRSWPLLPARQRSPSNPGGSRCSAGRPATAQFQHLSQALYRLLQLPRVITQPRHRQTLLVATLQAELLAR